MEPYYDFKIETTIAKIMERTSALRFVRDVLSGFPIRDKLQQAWMCRETGEIEWRDIEVVNDYK